METKKIGIVLKRHTLPNGITLSLLQENRFSFMIMAESGANKKTLFETESKQKAKKEFLEYIWTMI